MLDSKLKVGLIGLGEAGNFGDDLILISTVAALSSFPSVSDIKYIGYGQSLDWRLVSESIGLRIQPASVTPGRDFPGSRATSRVYADRDLIIFGGGGLIQTSHNPERPYQWLRFVPKPRAGSKVVAIGLGLGPISSRWEQRLKRLGMPFDGCYLRDADSVTYGNEALGWQTEICKDFVDEAFLKSLVPTRRTPADRVLGVSVRAWSDLSEDSLVKHVLDVAARVKPTAVRFFVLESKDGAGVDVDFTKKVMKRSALANSSLHVYSGGDLVGFMRNLTECSVAISMKLHSSAVWAAYDIPIYPVVYSPKIASFFGIPYSGTQIIPSIVAPHQESLSVPRAQDIVGLIVSSMPDKSPSGRSFMTAVQRFDSQVRSAFFVIKNRFRKGLKARQLQNRPYPT